MPCYICIDLEGGLVFCIFAYINMHIYQTGLRYAKNILIWPMCGEIQEKGTQIILLPMIGRVELMATKRTGNEGCD